MKQSASDAGANNADDSASSVSVKETRYKISQYLARAAGTGNWPTDHTIRCFVGMIQTGEATMEDFESVGGRFVVDLITETAVRNGWELCSE